MIKIFGIVIQDKAIYTVLTLAVGYLIYKLILRVINRAFAFRMKSEKTDKRRQKTVNIIINNILKYTFVVIVFLSILGILGVNTSAIIASIGVVGLAIGLAIQDILRDILAGLFILIENQYAIGDVVTIGGFKGEVIFLGLRTTKLRSTTGEIKIIPNRNVTDITNYSLRSAVLVIDTNLSYSNDESKIREAFTKLATKLLKSNSLEVKYLGIQNISDKVTYRISVETTEKHQEEIKSIVLSEMKKCLDNEGIER